MRGRRELAGVLRAGAVAGSRLGSALLVNKIIAVYLGPAGLAIVGQFQNLMAVVFGLTSGGISNAVVSTVARAESERERGVALGTSVVVFVVPTAIAAVLVAVFARVLSNAVLGAADLAWPIWVFAAAMIPIVLNVTLLGMLAGSGRATSFAAINSAIALAAVPVSWVLATRYGLSGALVASVLVNGLALVLTVWWSVAVGVLVLPELLQRPDPAQARALLRAAAMGVTTVVALPAAQMAVRGILINSAGIDEAGHWQAATKVGESLIMVATLFVSMQVLPMLAKPGSDRVQVLLRSALVVLSLASVGSLAAVGVRSTLVPLLFSPSFASVESFLGYQLAADSLRSVVVVIQAVFIATGRLWAYMSVDVVYAIVLVCAAWGLAPAFAASGGAMAAAAASVVALIVAVGLARRVPRSGVPAALSRPAPSGLLD